jgi:hypothetical protein
VEQDAPGPAAAAEGTAAPEHAEDPRKSAAFAEANADAADASTLRVIRALEECQQKDPSRDMRSRCAAALRQIGVRPLR